MDIVIVNWNSGSQLYELLNSIKLYHNELVKSVIIVDNASTDNSMSFIKRCDNLSFDLRILLNTINKGFAAACNQGALCSNNEYILFLNPDTLLYPDSLTMPINFMRRIENSNIGICGVKLIGVNGYTTISAARFPSLRVITGRIFRLTKFFPKLFPSHQLTSIELMKSGIVDQIIGAFFLIRRNVYVSCGGFDERFFVYFEEVDLSLRARQLGYFSYYLSEATAFHADGGCTNGIKSTRLFYSLCSRIKYAQKHYSKLEFIFLILIMPFELIFRLIHGAIIFSWSDIKNTVTAYIELVRYFLK